MKAPAECGVSNKERTKAYYDRLSRWYDLLAGEAEKKCKFQGLKMLDVQPGEKVLEIGFGTGLCLQFLAQAVGAHGKVYGIDLSTGMLQAAQTRLRKSGCLKRVELRQADAVQLPFEDGFFDAIYMSFTLELFTPPEIGRVLRECWRVLKSEGRISIVAMARKDTKGLMVKLYDWAHRKWPIYIDCCPIHVQGEVEQAGFKSKHILEMYLFGLPVDIILAKKCESIN